MSKACEIPQYETSYIGTWSGSKHTYTAIVSNTAGGNLQGRTVRETDYSTGNDTCWHPGSPASKFDGITQPDPFYLGSNNNYTDEIGWGQTSITHYRSHNDVPCGTTIYQQMQIACGPVGNPTYHGYQNNVISIPLTMTTVDVTRDGVQAGPVTY